MFTLYLDLESGVSAELKPELHANGWKAVEGRNSEHWTMVFVKSESFTNELMNFRRYLRHQFGRFDPKVIKRILLGTGKPLFLDSKGQIGKSVSEGVSLKIHFSEKESVIVLNFHDFKGQGFDEAVETFAVAAIQFCAHVRLYQMCEEALLLLEMKRNYRPIYGNLMRMQSEIWMALRCLTETQKDHLSRWDTSL